MILAQTLGGLLLVVGSILVIHAVWTADQPPPAQFEPRHHTPERRRFRKAA